VCYSNLQTALIVAFTIVNGEQRHGGVEDAVHNFEWNLLPERRAASAPIQALDVVCQHDVRRDELINRFCA
jgi:hypothetical protein